MTTVVKRRKAPARAAETKTWKCPECRHKTPEPRPMCDGCNRCSNPRLCPNERRIAAALGPLKAWLELHASGADDAQLEEAVRMRMERPAAGEAAIVRSTDDGPVCWRFANNEVQLWINRDEPGGDAGAWTTYEIAGELRKIYQIPQPVKPVKEPPESRQPCGCPQFVNGLKGAHEPGCKYVKDAIRTGERIETWARRDRAEAADTIQSGDAVPAPASHPIPEIDIAVDRIIASEDNPRQAFDEAALDELAASLKAHGQLQNLVVRRRGEQYELIAGERRWRAAKRAGLATLRCRILSVDDTAAFELRGIENVQREDLNSIEIAGWYRQLLDRCGFTQTALAVRLGVSQPLIANRLRLLQLPEAWRRRVITREITEGHARELVTWADVPDVLADLEQELKNDEGVPSIKVWKHWIARAVESHSRPLEGWYHFQFQTKGGTNYRNGQVLFTPEQIERWGPELDIREATIHQYGKAETKRRAFKVDRWWELHAGLEAEAKKQEQAREEKPAAKSKPSLKHAAAAARDKSAPARDEAGAQREREKRAREQERQKFERDVATYRFDWLLARIHERLADRKLGSQNLLRLALWFASMDYHDARLEFLQDALKAASAPRPRKQLDAESESLAWLAAAKNPDTVARAVLGGWICQEDDRQIEALAAFLAIDLAKEWTVDRGFLALHSAERLVELCRAWKLKPPGVPKDQDELIDAILSVKKRLPAPKYLVKVTP